MMNATSECPSATIASRDVGGDVGLGPARHQELRHPGVHPVDRGSRLAQRVDLRRILDHSQPAQHVGGEDRYDAEHVGQRQQVQCWHRIGDRGSTGGQERSDPGIDSGGAPRASATSRYGSSPSTQSRTDSPSSGTADSFSAASSIRGTTMVGSPAPPRNHQRREPLEGLRPRPEQIAQVVSGRDDQTRKACGGRGIRGGLQPVRVHVGAESARLVGFVHVQEANPAADSWRPRPGCRRGRGSSATSSAPARPSWAPVPR